MHMSLSRWLASGQASKSVWCNLQIVLMKEEIALREGCSAGVVVSLGAEDEMVSLPKWRWRLCMMAAPLWVECLSGSGWTAIVIVNLGECRHPRHERWNLDHLPFGVR